MASSGGPAATALPAPDIGALIGSLDDAVLGDEMYALVRELFPLCRSITGDGLRATLRTLQRAIPLVLHEVPTGTSVLDWTIPREWNLRRARLIAPDGRVVVDTMNSNLHVLNYSVPFHGAVTLDELQPHLHSLPDRPTAVPYRTSYYRDDWGFCVSEEQRRSLTPGTYEVSIDTTLAAGSLTYGEIVLRGTSSQEVFVSAHCCHPSLANDNLSGIALAATVARLIADVPHRYTYRFLFAPGTIGALAWLARNEDTAGRIAHGLVVACVGDAGPFTYKRSRRGDAPVDRAVAHVLERAGEPYRVKDFIPYGYDERQFCSPGFDLPVGCLTRTPYGEYPEYHTSDDDLGFVQAAQLAVSLRRTLQVFDVLEGDATYVNTAPKGEPQLGRRGLYGSIGGQSHAATEQMAMLWVLNLSDGTKSLLEIAERAGMAFGDIRSAARALERAGLLRPSAPDDAIGRR